MTEPPPISLVCLDLAGIVIDDSVVERAYAEAIATQGIVPGTQDYVRSMVRFDRSRGRPPAAVLRELFETDDLRAQVAVLAFDRSFRAAAKRFDVSVPAVVADAIGKAAGSGAHVALVTVLSRVRLQGPARPAPHGRPGALRRRRAPELPVAGPGAHRDAEARHLRRARGGGGQRHRGRRALRLPGRGRAWSRGSAAAPGRPRRCARPAPPMCSTASRCRSRPTRARHLRLVGMPELPEVEALAVFLREHASGRVIARAEAASFAVLKTFDPPLSALSGRDDHRDQPARQVPRPALRRRFRVRGRSAGAVTCTW